MQHAACVYTLRDSSVDTTGGTERSVRPIPSLYPPNALKRLDRGALGLERRVCRRCSARTLAGARSRWEARNHASTATLLATYLRPVTRALVFSSAVGAGVEARVAGAIHGSVGAPSCTSIGRVACAALPVADAMQPLCTRLQSVSQ